MIVSELTQVLQSFNAEDAFRPRLTEDQWKQFHNYLARQALKPGELLIRQGDNDRTLYFLGQGNLEVFLGEAGTNRPAGGPIAILRPGAIVGEPSLFRDGLRMANTQAITPVVVFALRGPRFDEMSQRAPALALEVLRAAGSVMAARMRANMSR